MVRKISIIGIFIFSFAGLSHTQEQEDRAVATIVDRSQPFSDRENLLISRMNGASLVGNSSLMLDYYSSLMQSFMAQDKQTEIIDYSLELLPKILVYQNYIFVTELLSHLSYRVKFFSRAPAETKKKWEKTIRWYKAIVPLLQQDFPASQTIPDDLIMEISEEKKKPSVDLILQELALGLTEKSFSESKFQHLYVALDTANTLHNAEMYYLISTILIKLYLTTKEYSSAIVRLNLLYQLFSAVQPSDYYRIKILIYFTQVFLAKGDKNEAYTSYLRAREMLLYNHTISSQEVDRLQALIKQIDFDKSVTNTKDSDLNPDFFAEFMSGGSKY